MKKKKAHTPFLYLAFIVFLPWWISLLFTKGLESWVTNWWNSRQSETSLHPIQDKSLIAKFIELEELLLLDEMLKESSKVYLEKFPIGLHKETVKLMKMHNEDQIHIILHFSQSLLYFLILSGSSILGKEQLVILNSWFQEFFSNLSDTIKALCIILLTDILFGFHSKHTWECIIGYVCKGLGCVHNERILSTFGWIMPSLLDTTWKFVSFRYLNSLSPSLLAMYTSMKD
uniref:Chloroplast envelope membrane protein n=1 Tax=Erodium absinthoides TaxID=337345 RepID=A0A0D3M021_9ROSI|nr:chloroplast envelope membrane protein [Erodium absinthoides]AIA26373.1 chloroplast envelope membrane protein [Erodium absinthoides]